MKLRSRALDYSKEFGTKGRESEGREGVLGMLLKLLVKDKLLHSGKVPVNAELRPLRREKRGTEVQRYGTLNEAMKGVTEQPTIFTQDCHTYISPFIPVLSLPKRDWIQQY